MLHIEVTGTGTDFLLRLVPLADIIPIPIPPVQNVASIGDLFLTAGLAFFLFATLMRTPAETQAAIDEAKTGRYLGLSGTARLPEAHGAPEGERTTGPRRPPGHRPDPGAGGGARPSSGR